MVRRRRERGSSLVEVLIAFVIMMVISLSVLQLFSMAMAVNLGSLARTELTYKAQHVAEVIRVLQALGRQTPPVDLSGQSGIPVPLASGTYRLPVRPTDAYGAFWGPLGANVLEEPPRVRLVVSVDDRGTVWVVTVEALPNTAEASFVGAGIEQKAVRYVAQIAK
jgi:type II secretory pathway pseudopilin PulG